MIDGWGPVPDVREHVTLVEPYDILQAVKATDAMEHADIPPDFVNNPADC
jgi:hypothetical protein